jgi:hypothetical protein
MAIYARIKDSEFSPAPEGLWPAVCCDVFDLGLVNHPVYGMQEKILITWQLAERDPKTNKRYQVSRRFTPSLGKKSHLRPLLESWRGRKFTAEEEKEFDIEKLLGANCQVQIIHNIVEEGKTYANVQACVPYPKKEPRLAVEEYTRRIDREKKYEENPDGEYQGGEGEEYVPF